MSGPGYKENAEITRLKAIVEKQAFEIADQTAWILENDHKADIERLRGLLRDIQIAWRSRLHPPAEIAERIAAELKEEH